MVDLYPGYYFVRTESKTMHADWITSKEFVVTPPTHLGKTSLVFICSHGGNTKETVEAAHLAKDLGAAVVAMTHTPGSACDDSSLNPIVYSWEDDTNEKDKPQGIVLNILNELMKAQEPDYKLYDAVADGLEKADGIVRAAVKSVKTEHGFLLKNMQKNRSYISWVQEQLMHLHMDLLFAHFRRCSGWIAAT